jgi:hypothetical protein
MKLLQLGATGFALLTASTLLSCSSDEGSQRPSSGGTAGASGGAGSGGAAAGSSGAGAGGNPGGSGGSAGSAGAGGSAGSAGSAGTGGSAGSAGSAGTGGSGGSGGCGTALICDDFEDDTLDQEPGVPWTKNVDDHGGVVITSDDAFSGEKSVKVTLDANPGYKRAYFFTEGAPLFPAAKDMLWGRMMIKTDAAPNSGVHWTNIEGQGAVAGESYRALIRYGGQQMGKLMANYETQGVSSDCWHHSQQAMPTGDWACMEWQFDAATDTMTFYLDDTQVTDLTVQNANDPPGNGDGCISDGTAGKWNFPVFDKVSLGLELYQDDPARTVYIDDVALGTERIHCPAAQ